MPRSGFERVTVITLVCVRIMRHSGQHTGSWDIFALSSECTAKDDDEVIVA